MSEEGPHPKSTFILSVLWLGAAGAWYEKRGSHHVPQLPMPHTTVPT
jgi:hypothetical protein